MKKTAIIALMLVLVSQALMSQTKPYGLRTDLIERTDVVYINGYPTMMTISDIGQTIEPVQFAAIATPKPNFSWVMDGGSLQDVVQTAYQIVVSRELAVPDPKKTGQVVNELKVVWDSGKVSGNQSAGVAYAGPALEPSAIYKWKVKTWDNSGNESGWSELKAFKTAAELDPKAISIEPQVKTDQFPAPLTKTSEGNYFADFGKAAFGQLRLTLSSRTGGEKVVLHLGERIKDGKVDRKPSGSCRYRRIELTLMPGTHTYQPKILPDYRNTHGDAVLMPEYIGEVLPFRYVEIEGYDGGLDRTDITRMYVHHPFNEFSSDFKCSDDILNQVWNLCKYSMYATSFIGYHIDGDRERIPYELDALVNQLAYYGADDGYSLTRRSTDYLFDYPTWPTEWILQTVLLSWYDYLYTGDTRLLESRYDILCRHTLKDLRGANGLISTRAEEQSGAFLAGINRKEPIKDIVDWPQGKGSFGLDGSSPGEADYFDFQDYNTVVNAYHYETLVCMAGIAEAIGKGDEAAKWQSDAENFKAIFNKQLLKAKAGNYRDGIGTEHSALHSNMFPLAFDMVPDKQKSKVADFAESRGMVCSIGNSRFILEAMYKNGHADYALSLMNATHDRGWYNTILAGSTITFEAWDDHYKPNQDWNHAWGAAPADILPHNLIGVTPSSPGWATMCIHPQIASLTDAEAIVPTIKGPVSVKVYNNPDDYTLMVNIPANTTATVYVPAIRGKKSVLTVNDEAITAAKDPSGEFFIVESVGSGNKVFHVK